MRDSLTGVWNRAAVLEVLARELARARRERSDVGVLMLDVDHFKRINDTFGHPAGDAVLRDLSRRLARTLRRYDAIGRLGGEEFLIVLPGCDGARTRSAAERLRAAIAGEPMGSPECAVSVTASFGGAACERGLALDVAALVRAADAALYRAKRSGRDRVETESLAPAQPAA
jgi:diguanylate cyclase (GGDEF)-like protein